MNGCQPSTSRTLSGDPLQARTAAPRTAPVARDGRLMQHAIELAKDGEIGNSDAIALLEMPHHPEDLREILHRFDAQLTREARGKLSLAAFVPRPDAVANQRYEPIFDRYPISGKTYTTASGTVTLNEVQY